MAVYEAWFWKETRRGLAAQARKSNPKLPPDPEFDPDNWQLFEAHAHLKEQAAAVGVVVPDLQIHRKGLAGEGTRFPRAIATGMVVFAPVLRVRVPVADSQLRGARERCPVGAPSSSAPASPARQLLTAKFMFYPAFGLGLAATLSAIYKPDRTLRSVLLAGGFIAVGGGFLGINGDDNRGVGEDATGRIPGWDVLPALGVDGPADLLNERHTVPVELGGGVPRAERSCTRRPGRRYE